MKLTSLRDQVHDMIKGMCYMMALVIHLVPFVKEIVV